MSRVWGGRQGVAALGVVAVMVGWRAVLLADSFFNQDDFYLSGRAYRSDLTLDFLFRDTAGHVNPLQQLTFWLVAHHAPYDWGVTAGFVLALQVAATVAMWHVLTRLLPGRWVRVPLLAVFAWAPLTLVTTLWWSAAMAFWPHLLTSLVAVLFLLRLRQGAGRPWANHVVILGAFVVGLLWHERAVLIVPVLLGTAVVLADEAVGWRRITAALRRFRVLWVALALLLVGYLVAHGAMTDVEGGGGTLRESLAISWSFVGENVVPGLTGGPWSARLEGGAVMPPWWVTVASVALVAVVTVLVLLRGGPSRRWAVAFFVAYVAADLVLVLGGRGGFGRLIGLDPRYSGDVLHAAVLCLALGLRDAPPAYGFRLAADAWRRWRTTVVAGLVAAYLVAATFGTAVLVPHFQNTEDRRYLTHLRDDLAADPRQVIVDDLAPSDVVLALVGQDSLLSRILAPLPEAPAFDQPSSYLRVVDDDGRLVPVELAGSIPMRPARDGACGYRATALAVSVPFAVEIGGSLLLRVGYFTDEETTVKVRAGSWSTTFRAVPGPNEMWVPVPDLGVGLDSVRFVVDGPGTVCLPLVEAGRAEEP